MKYILKQLLIVRCISDTMQSQSEQKYAVLDPEQNYELALVQVLRQSLDEKIPRVLQSIISSYVGKGDSLGIFGQRFTIGTLESESVTGSWTSECGLFYAALTVCSRDLGALVPFEPLRASDFDL